MSLNLQWLAYPIWIYALYNLLFVLLAIPHLWGPEIMPLLAINVIVIYGAWAIGLALLGGLVWLAFRNMKIGLTNDKT